MRIFVNSLPKSGTNLATKLLELLGFKENDFSIATSSTVGKFQLIKQLTRSNSMTGNQINVGLQLNASVSASWLNKKIHGVKGYEYFSGHAAYSDELSSVLEEKRIFTILVVRHPLAVLNSWIHYIDTTSIAKNHPNSILKGYTLKDRMDAIIRGGVFGSNYINAYAEILSRTSNWKCKDKSVFVLKFEDLVGPNGGGSLSSYKDALTKIKERTSTVDVDIVYKELFGKSKTFRSGDTDSWKSELPESNCLDRLKKDKEYLRFKEIFGY